jgi:periplasmic protein CpxP/Spy
MEITALTKFNYPSSTMFNKLAQVLPVLALTIGTPAFASIAQAHPHHGDERIADGRMGRQLNRLNLTPEQKAKQQQLRQSMRAQIKAILTPEQQAQAKAMRNSNRSMDGARKSLNLTPDQKAKMKAIRQDYKQKFKAILTPEQQAQLKGGRKG